jgi:thiamine transport system ATP-binding protein
MLTLEGLLLRQGDFEIRADLTIQTGLRVALMGPSGAGKSTLLAAIAGFLRPVAGRILWDKVDLVPLQPAARPVSILFQDNNLFPHLTIEQNLGLGIAPRAGLTAEERSAIATILTKVGLGGLGGKKPAALSGGQQSRAALARVLLADRPLVLLDEPFSALGPGLKDEMLDLAAQMITETGRTLLMVTHDPDDALRIADQCIVVSSGKAAMPVETAYLFADPPHALRHYLGLVPRLVPPA